MTTPAQRVSAALEQIQALTSPAILCLELPANERRFVIVRAERVAEAKGWTLVVDDTPAVELVLDFTGKGSLRREKGRREMSPLGIAMREAEVGKPIKVPDDVKPYAVRIMAHRVRQKFKDWKFSFIEREGMPMYVVRSDGMTKGQKAAVWRSVGVEPMGKISDKYDFESIAAGQARVFETSCFSTIHNKVRIENNKAGYKKYATTKKNLPPNMIEVRRTVRKHTGEIV